MAKEIEELEAQKADVRSMQFDIERMQEEALEVAGLAKQDAAEAEQHKESVSTGLLHGESSIMSDSVCKAQD